MRLKLDAGSVFKKLNKDCYGTGGIDYPSVVISYGSVAGVEITSAEVSAQGKALVTFDGGTDGKNGKDEFWLFVFCPDMKEGRFAELVARTAGRVTVQVPDVWLGHELHLYAFMKNAQGRTSRTMYVGRF